MQNQITTHQNEPRFLKLLRARSETYREASHWQIAQFVLTVITPLVGAVVAIMTPDARPYVAAAALVIAMLDSSLIDRIQKQKLKTAARIAEQFDCELLEMAWNPYAAGKKVEPEVIEDAAQRWPNGEVKLKGWYPSAVEQVPIHLARIICQRTNLWYDGTLREKYSSILLWSAIVIAILLFSVGFAAQLSLIDFVAVVIAPVTPVFGWTLREFFRQRDAAEALKLARSEAEALWATALNGGCEPSECARRSREFQNTIFARRANNPLIFPKIYDRLRSSLEIQMNRGAEAYVNELKDGG
ncbi:S-4TM family putative pore-forming effector [Novosphingobium aquae]|uniref:S-4TM family putative pore-forming effector n=1 Tax=Novosphingobium aquae TaxID=3133435 RepID=A0ABU8S479_9SPHN